MVRKLLISDVSPGEKDWSCKVCVVKKLDAQDSKTTPGNKYRPIILQDEAAMAYANEIDIFDNKLSLNATYIITDAIVSIPRGNLVLPDERYNCLWTLTRKCTVAVVTDEDRLEVMEDPEIDEISFSHFHKYINTMKKSLPRKHVDSKNGKIDAADFVLVDKQALSNSVTLHSLILTYAFNDAYLKLADLSSEQFVTIADVKSSIIENESIDMQNVIEKLDNKTFKVELLCKKHNFRGTKQVRYSIISLQEQKKIAHAKRVKRKLIYDDTDDNISDDHSKAFGDFDNEVTDKKSKLVKLG
nr:replication protein A 70 kDa DNA-binding subunit B-like [Ipomoea batatas]GMD03394.1 replication protein A 70 kDa DNA-binding subunit B-like [Ipomoea batatas]